VLQDPADRSPQGYEGWDITIRMTVCVGALLLVGCTGNGGEAAETQVADALAVEVADGPRIAFTDSWSDLDADQQVVYCQTHALIGREEAHELFLGRLGDDAEVPSLFAWSQLIDAECPPIDIAAAEPAEVDEVAEEEPDPPPDTAAEDVLEAEPALPEVPRLEGAVVPATAGHGRGSVGRPDARAAAAVCKVFANRHPVRLTRDHRFGGTASHKGASGGT
jgi:hypothetical protein